MSRCRCGSFSAASTLMKQRSLSSSNSQYSDRCLMMYNAAVRGSPKMEIPHAASRSLDYASGLQLAWALIWPTIVFDLVVWGPRDNLGLTPQQVDSVDSILMMIGLFVIMPWVVRR